MGNLRFSTMPPTHLQKHQAGRYLVAAEALLRGYDAHPVGPTSLVEVNGRHAEVHVATNGRWQISDIDKFLAGTTEYVIFVDLGETAPEYFILEGARARSVIGRSHQKWLDSKGGTRPRTPKSKHSLVPRDLVEEWEGRWAVFGQ
jgi:hypothetical protein